MRRLNNLTYCIFVSMALMGCALKPAVVLKLKPPVELLQECVASTYPVTTNGELATGILLERSALALCNNDKAALREWSKD